MELNRIKILVNRYFDGTTTSDEEIELAHYLKSSDNLPEELVSIKMMFEAMGLLRQTEAPKTAKESKRRVSWSYITAAVTVAASLILTLIITTNKEVYNTTPAIICHVDGSLVSDQTAAEQEARRILGNMNANITLAMASIDKINILKTN